jgi:hypothetical protein
MRKAVVFRIAMWSSAGILVSVGWGLYFASTSKSLPIEPIAYTLASLTQPTAAAALQLKLIHQLGLAWAVALNAVTYALLGLIVEWIRQHNRAAT